MRLRPSALACLAALPLLLFLACRSPYQRDSGTGSVTIGFSAKAKTILPNFAAAVSQYRVSASKSGSATQTKTTPSGGSVAFENLEAGSWKFDAAALDAAGASIGAGSATLNVSSGLNATLGIPIAFAGLTGAGTGGFSIKVLWPADLGIGSVTASMTGISLISSIPTMEGQDYQTTIVGNDIPVGPHALTLTFMRGSASAGAFVESVNICSGLTANSWIDGNGKVQPAWTFQTSDFLDASASLGGLSIAGAGFSFDPSITTYYLYPFDADNVSFTPSSSIDGQYITYSWNQATPVELANNATPSPLEFESWINPNVLSITVTAPDRSTHKTYDLHIQIYNVIYDANGGSGDPPVILVSRPAGRSVTLTDAGSMTNAGYGFVGWNSLASGTGTHYDAGSQVTLSTSNITLYAQWANPSLAAALGSMKAGGSFIISGPMSAGDLSLLKQTLLAAAASVALDMRNVTLDVDYLGHQSLPYGAFSDCTMLSSIALPNSLEVISDSCFSGCTGLTSLSIPDSVISAGAQFIAGCTNLQSLHLGAQLGYVPTPPYMPPSRMFEGPLPNLTTITVSVSPPSVYYSVIGGVLYGLGDKILIRYPAGQTGAIFSIPSGTMTIGYYAFQDCKVGTIVVPTSINNIMAGAFGDYSHTVQFLSTSPGSISNTGGSPFGSSPPPTLMVPATPANVLGDYQTKWPGPSYTTF